MRPDMGGQLIVARGPRGRARLAALAAQLERLELPHERLDDDGLRRCIRLSPEQDPGAPDDGPSGVRLPMAGTLHPVRFLAGLAKVVAGRETVSFSSRRGSPRLDAADRCVWSWPAAAK